MTHILSPSTMDEEPPPSDPITELITTYNELNSSVISEITGNISPLEFMRYVARNRPFVFRGGASEWEATQTWNVPELKALLKGQSVNVAVTPKGYVLDSSSSRGVDGWNVADDIETRIPPREMGMESYCS